MVAFTFVVRKEGKSWHAARVAAETEDEGEAIEATADDTYRCGKYQLLYQPLHYCIGRASFCLRYLCWKTLVLMFHIVSEQPAEGSIQQGSGAGQWRCEDILQCRVPQVRCLPGG